MNDKFKMLALQAQMGTADFDAGSYYVATPDKMQKFAELIVKECMSIAKQVENDKFEITGSAEPEYRKGVNDGRRNAAWGIKNRMKLHFGVEEWMNELNYLLNKAI